MNKNRGKGIRRITLEAHKLLYEQVNKQKVEVLKDGEFVPMNWGSVVVGDIVRVKCDHEFPADLVFLSSSDPKGLAYVETSNLDGEPSLKVRNAFYQGSTGNDDDETPLSIFSGLTLECELPNNRLYKFEGAINLQVDHMYGYTAHERRERLGDRGRDESDNCASHSLSTMHTLR